MQAKRERFGEKGLPGILEKQGQLILEVEAALAKICPGGKCAPKNVPGIEEAWPVDRLVRRTFTGKDGSYLRPVGGIYQPSEEVNKFVGV